MSDEHLPGSTVLVVNLERDAVPAVIVRRMTEACECGGTSWLCDVKGRGLYTVCASAIRRPN